MAVAQQYCTFEVDSLFFGVEVMRVQEVVRYQQLTQVPLAPPVIRGLINLRGQIVTAIDLRRLLDLPPRAAELLPTNVILTADHGAVSMLVDEIGDVIEPDEACFEAPPETLDPGIRELIRGAYKLDRLLLILDTQRTVTRAQVRARAA